MFDADDKDSNLIHDLKARGAKIPAEHVRTFIEFLAHHAEPLGLTPQQREDAPAPGVLAALFATFIPEHKHQVIYSEQLFDSVLEQIDAWNEDRRDGDRDAAELNLDNDLRVLVPPRRTTVGQTGGAALARTFNVAVAS